jgi:hypothetical protein
VRDMNKAVETMVHLAMIWEEQASGSGAHSKTLDITV